MSGISSIVTVHVVADQWHQGTQHLELHLDKPLLAQNVEVLAVTPGDDIQQHKDKCTDVMWNILDALLGSENIGVTNMFVTDEHLTIDYFAALTKHRILDIIEKAAHDAGLLYELSSDAQ